MRQPKLSLIQIQDRFVERVNTAHSRWGHRIKTVHFAGGGSYTTGGHYSRARRAAWREASRDLQRWGLTETQVEQAIRDADDVAKMQRLSEE